MYVINARPQINAELLRSGRGAKQTGEYACTTHGIHLEDADFMHDISIFFMRASLVDVFV